MVPDHIRIDLRCDVTTVIIWNRKEGTPPEWIAFRESLIVVWGKKQ